MQLTKSQTTNDFQNESDYQRATLPSTFKNSQSQATMKFAKPSDYHSDLQEFNSRIFSDFSGIVEFVDLKKENGEK